MPATLEVKVFILRVGKEHKIYGDPYEFSATVTCFNGVAHIEGATEVSPDWKSIVKVLQAEKIHTIEWDRVMDDGIFKHYILDISKRGTKSDPAIAPSAESTAYNDYVEECRTWGQI
jgi:hypothetical protein